ncbi:MAG: hypothetical protein LBN23_05645 [Paludibacter sp.]|jgi:hypothetical protein|nr:hypothetical protein [Paludibacter sp.]
MNIKKNFSEDDIFVFKGIVPLIIIFITIVIIVEYKFTIPKDILYGSEFSGRVNQIYDEPKNRYFLLDDTWYLIKDNFIDYITEGDSVCKIKDSFQFLVFNNQNKIKWQGESKRVYFKQKEPQ